MRCVWRQGCVPSAANPRGVRRAIRSYGAPSPPSSRLVAPLPLANGTMTGCRSHATAPVPAHAHGPVHMHMPLCLRMHMAELAHVMEYMCMLERVCMRVDLGRETATRAFHGCLLICLLCL